MTAKTIIQFQFGSRSAIEAAATSRATLLTGILLVLITSIPRNYDQLAITEDPLKWIFGSLVFSAGSGTFLFLFVYVLRTSAIKDDESHRLTAGRVAASWIGFMGLFWMTAPIAWLYAIPVERLIDDPVARARANLNLLAIVSAWRVVLMARVLQVACRWHFGRAFCWVLAAACVEVIAIAFSSAELSRSLMASMGGMRNSPAEDLLIDSMCRITVLALYTFPFAFILGAFVRFEESPRPLPERSGDRVPTGFLASSAVAWIAVSVIPQSELVRSVRLETLVADGEYRAAIELMGELGEDGFAPSRELPPRAYEWEIFDSLPGMIAAAEPTDEDWVQDLLISRLDRMLRHLVAERQPVDLNERLDPEHRLYHRGPRWGSIADSEWQALLSGLRRIERGRAWLEQHPNFERRLEEEQRVDRGEPGGAPEEPAP